MVNEEFPGSEPDFRMFFEKLDRSAIIVDSKGRILKLNEAAGQLFNKSESGQLFLSGQSLKNLEGENPGGGFFPVTFINPEIEEPIFESILFTGKILGTGGGDSQYFFLIINVSPVMDSDEEGAFRSQEQLRFDTRAGRSPLVWVLDTEFKYLSYNEGHEQEMKKIWGADIRKGDSILNFLNDSRYKRLVIYNYNRALSGEHFYTIDELKDSEGNARYFENVLGPYLDEHKKIQGLRVRTTELTDPEEVKDRLQMSIAVQRSLIEGYGNIGISSLDRYFRYRAFNDGYRRFMDEVRDVKIRIGASLLDSLASDTLRHEVRQKLEEVFNGERFSEVRSYPGKEGKVFYYQHDYFPVVSGLGEVIGITTFSLDVTEKMSQERAIRDALKENEVLFREIHFRIKNNLQVVSSLLNLQMGAVDDPNVEKNLQDVFFRVQTMALIHEQLFQGKTLGSVKTREFIGRMVAMLVDMHDFDTSRVSLNEDVDDFDLDLDTAIPLGLILNELFTNSLKYAFSGSTDGELGVCLKKSGKSIYNLMITDRGDSGWKPVKPEVEYSLGLKLASSLAEQLGGELLFDFSCGTQISFSFEMT